jgi:hypothetical protein
LGNATVRNGKSRAWWERDASQKELTVTQLAPKIFDFFESICKKRSELDV